MCFFIQYIYLDAPGLLSVYMGPCGIHTPSVCHIRHVGSLIDNNVEQQAPSGGDNSTTNKLNSDTTNEHKRKRSCLEPTGEHTQDTGASSSGIHVASQEDDQRCDSLDLSSRQIEYDIASIPAGTSRRKKRQFSVMEPRQATRGDKEKKLKMYVNDATATFAGKKINTLAMEP